MFHLIDENLILDISQQAVSHPRLRQFYCLHSSPDEKVQRFLNALQPGTYVRPHKHSKIESKNCFELFIVLLGVAGLVFFNERGQIIHQEKVSPQENVYGIELTEGLYHTAVALVPNTVILEVKEGPYIPGTDKEYLSLFPLEGTIEAQELVQHWQSLFNLSSGIKISDELRFY